MSFDHDSGNGLSVVLDRLRKAGQTIGALGDRHEARAIASFCASFDHQGGGRELVLTGGSAPTVIDAEQQAAHWPKDYREQFWNAYPRRIGKAVTMRKLDVMARTAKVAWPVFIAAVRAYGQAKHDCEMRYIAHPITWLNQGRWDDDPGGNDDGGGAPQNGYLASLKEHHHNGR